MSLPLGVNNRFVFSDVYLEELVQEDSFWQSSLRECQKAWEKLHNLYKKAKNTLPNLNEEEAERRFIRPALDILGHAYTLRPPVESPEGIRRPDFAFFPSESERNEAEALYKGKKEFFTKALAVGDAKAWERSLDRKIKGPGDPFTNQNPSYQIDFYLRATDLKWGIITNGCQWRLYNRETSYRLDVFYEIDLPLLLETFEEEAFNYFYAFFRKEAFEKDASGACFLDRAYKASLDYTARVGEELKDNVYEALRLLCEGFLHFPGNRLSESDLDRIRENAFVLIYRLLFIFYAESRGLLPTDNLNYQTYSLRSLAHEVAQRLDSGVPLSPTTQGYWARLNDLFRIVNEGDTFLGVPPYNGGLFDDEKHPFLKEYRIGDKYLAEAIDKLARTEASGRRGKGFINYRDLDIRHIGSIYEGLLEHRPRIAKQDMVVIKEKGVEKFVPLSGLANRKALPTYPTGSVYLETDKGERKATGSYFTPRYIVQYIVQNTLGPILEEKKKAGGDLIDEILSLKVLDPAMGSGHFLVEATDFLARALVEALGASPKEVGEEEIRWARREIVERCIYGVDLNPLAVELAKLSLWLATVAKGKPLNFLDHHLKVGNSLIGARVEDLGALPASKKAKKEDEAETARQLSLFEQRLSEKLPVMLGEVMEIILKSTDTLSDVEAKKQHDALLEELKKPFKAVANLWLSTYFGNEVSRQEYEVALSNIGVPAQLLAMPEVQKAQKIAEQKRFFHWELEFPEVFFDKYGRRKENPGFDVVIGNPPYEVLSARESKDPGIQQFIEFFRDTSLTIKGKQNLYRLMIEKAFSLLSLGAYLGFIVPATILADQSATCLRQFIFQKSSGMYFYVFPERARVFEDVTQAVCILITQRGEGPNLVSLATDLNNAEDLQKAKPFMIPLNLLELIDPRNLSIPLISKPAWGILLKIHQWPPLSPPNTLPLAEIFQGEVNLTVFSECIKTEPTNTLLIRGEHLGRYSVRLDRMPNEAGWLDKNLFLSLAESSSKAHHYKQERVAYQEVVNMQLERRLNFTIVPKGVFLGHTVNYLCNFRSRPHYLLALLNSQLLNWRFKLTSTNNHVSGAEVRSLPIRRINLTTPEPERNKLVEEGKALYQAYLESGDWCPILDFVDKLLPRKPDGSPDMEREHSDVVHDLLAFLAERMIELNKEKQAEIKGFLSWLESYIGAKVEDLSKKTKIKSYYESSWEEFYEVLKANKRKITVLDISRRQPQETIRSEFETSLAKLNPILKQIELTDKLIDQIVYKLYGLTEEEIAIVEGRS